MRAVLCKELGLPEKLVVDEVPSPSAGKGQVVLSVKACGVNFPDTLIIQGKYQFKPELPFSPGGEVAGVVKEVGAGVAAVKPGDRVIASSTWGGFAEELVVEADRTIPMPEAMDFVPASAFVLTYGTSYHALKDRGQLQAGETLLVLGASGGVGISAIQIGKMMGARVIAAASTDQKLQVCKDNGADEVINYAEEDLRARVKELTSKQGVDVIYDPVGGPFSELALRDMAWNGRFLVVGFAAGEIPKVPLNLTLLKGCSIVGVFWGAFTRKEPENNRRNNEELLRFFVEGKVKPHIYATYPLEQAAQALNDVMYKRVSGKVVLTT
ncbi:MAG: NADPH:quinone oxidoreductase family protein [Betaproteobacteria bacterium]|jgi:NADPH2:quinone reductase|nr:MAG: NADPH:quinone oxidoreductase family protein [Betaproteobacteria bacterium]